MDPAIANQDFDPPRQRVLAPGLVPAVLAHVLLAIALAWGVHWQFGDDLPSLPFGSRAASASQPAQEGSSTTPDANDTSRMGAAPAPSAAAVPVPAGTAAPVSAAPARPLPSPEPTPPAADASLHPKAEGPRVNAARKPAETKTQVASLTQRPAARAHAAQPADPAELRMQPSFDCGKARSATERLICRDPQLSRMDRELGRIHAQAKRAAADPQDFKRENDEEWRMREAVCRDKDCLLEWYAHRRQQLQERLAQTR